MQDMGCTLAILLFEEGPQLCDQGLVTQWAIRRHVGIEIEILDLGPMFLGDFSRDFRLLSTEVCDQKDQKLVTWAVCCVVWGIVKL